MLAKFKKNNPDVLIPDINDLSKMANINYYKKNYFYSDKPISKGVWTPNGLTWRYFPNIDEYKLFKEKIIDLNVVYWTKSYTLSPLSKNEKSVFFLDHIYEIYANQMSYAVDFLLANGKNSEVKKILERFYPSLNGQHSFQTAYLKYYQIEKKCTKNSDEMFNKLFNRPIRKPADYKYLARYAKLCKKNDIKLIEKLEKEIINQTSTNSQNKETNRTVR